LLNVLFSPETGGRGSSKRRLRGGKRETLRSEVEKKPGIGICWGKRRRKTFEKKNRKFFRLAALREDERSS